MKPELESALIHDFPGLFSAVESDRRAMAEGRAFGCMAFGCDVGDGWYPLLRRMCARLAAVRCECPITLDQVKEKFGTLRVYFHGGDIGRSEAEQIVERAERESGAVCEHCGAPGVLRAGGWLLTLCDKCADGRPPYAEGD